MTGARRIAFLVGGHDQPGQPLRLSDVLKALDVFGDVVGLAAADVVIGDENAGDGALFHEGPDFVEALEANHDAPSETFEAGGIGVQNFGARQELERPFRRRGCR